MVKSLPNKWRDKQANRRRRNEKGATRIPPARGRAAKQRRGKQQTNKQAGRRKHTTQPGASACKLAARAGKQHDGREGLENRQRGGTHTCGRAVEKGRAHVGAFNAGCGGKRATVQLRITTAACGRCAAMHWCRAGKPQARDTARETGAESEGRKDKPATLEATSWQRRELASTQSVVDVTRES